MNIEQQPKHKPISKTQTNANNQEGKTQNQVKRSSRMKTHTCYLKILSRNSATMEFENGCKECLERRQMRKKMNSHKSSREN